MDSAVSPDQVLGWLAAAEKSGSAFAGAVLILAGLVWAASRFGLFSLLAGRTSVQSETFQDRLLAALAASHAREDALAGQLADLTRLNGELREQVASARVEVHLMRQQLRLLIADIRAVKAGEIGPDALHAPDVIEEAGDGERG